MDGVRTRKGGEGAAGEMAWAPGVGRAADGLQRTGSLWPSAGTAMRGMVREYTGGLWREFAGTFGCAVRCSHGAVTGVEWLAVGQLKASAGEELPKIRPAREKNRRHTTCSPRPVRAVQRARCDLYRQPGGVGGETARRLSPTYFRSRMGDLGMAAVVGLQLRFPRPGR